MGGHDDERFERDMGCTEHEWLQALPRAVGEAPLRVDAGAATVGLGDGRLQLRWQPLPPRVIASVRLPRLHVAFAFDGVAAAERERFMRRFDLFMQRGGG